MSGSVATEGRIHATARTSARIPEEPRMKKSDLSSHVAHAASLSKVEASGVVDAVVRGDR